MRPYQVRLDLGAMAINGYSAFPNAPALLKPHHQIVWCHFRDTCWGVLPLCRDTVDIFYSPSQLSCQTRSEAMQKVSAHQLERYYKLQWLPFSGSVTLYMRHQLARIEILPNFLFTLVYIKGGMHGVTVNVRRTWIQLVEFKSWTRWFGFYFTLMPLRKAWKPSLLIPAMSK